MFETSFENFKEIAPYVVLFTTIAWIFLLTKVKRKDILEKDGSFALFGSVLGIIITFLNLKHTNNYLISLGPLLALTCLLYLLHKDIFLGDRSGLDLSDRSLRIINISYWLCIVAALLSYYESPPYHRSLIFFIFISIGASIISLEIISLKIENHFNILFIIIKIFVLSLILRASAYFISPYPVGIDPWVHAQYINYFLQFHHVMLPSNSNDYYCQYPLSHLFVCVANLIGQLTIKESMFIIGVVLVFSTIFIYLFVKKVTGKVNLALLSVLLLNFAEFHIQWSIQVIAMSFGISIYAMILYLIFEIHEKNDPIKSSFLIMAFLLITWTHTVSSFITLISITSLYVGEIIYIWFYRKNNCNEPIKNFTLTLLLAVLLLYHWMDPSYPFIEFITKGLVQALSVDAGFLARPELEEFQNVWDHILDIAGYLIYIFFAIIGCLIYSSKNHANRKLVSIIFLLLILNFWFFAFPVMGIRNIVPHRWPVFIYSSLLLFSSKGMMSALNFIEKRYYKILFFSSIVFISSFLMMVNSVSNMDSPFFAVESNERFIWTQSEMTLFQKINQICDTIIIADSKTSDLIFKMSLKREKTMSYLLTSEGYLDTNYINNNSIIWRKISLSRPTSSRPKITQKILGIKFKDDLDRKLSNTYDTGDAKAYLGTH